MRYTIAGHLCWLVGVGLIGYVSITLSLSVTAILPLFGAGILMEIAGVCLGTAYARKKYLDTLYETMTGKKRK